MGGVLLLYLLLLTFQRNVEGSTRIDPLVDSKVGLIRGLRATDGAYSMFLGIPFGKVDENNPFGAASPYPPFEDVFEAYENAVFCPQVEQVGNTIVGTPDCLQLNIYVPNSASSQNRLPVLVWIHGGAYRMNSAGSGLYGPKFLMKNDVILVSINYRLGPYGFMCLDIPEVPGNQGLKDQLLALQWIKNNIGSFGGDLNQITVMGESAGAYSIAFHLQSNQEKLFHKAILQSGTNLLPTVLTDSKISTPLIIAESLGFNTTDVSKALSFLASADPLLVIAASTKLYYKEYFYPCVEKEFENVEALITDYPVSTGVPKVKGMPVLLGFNHDERVSYYANEIPEYFKSYNEIKKNLKAGFNFDENSLNKMENLIRHFYLGDEEISYDVRLKLADIDSDLSFVHPAERTIDMYLNNGAEKIYYYKFSYVGDRNWARWKNNITVGGAAHADELGYLFDVLLWTDQPSDEDQLMIDRITAMWTNFVKYSDPTPESTDLLPVKWEAITSAGSRLYLDIDSTMAAGKRPLHQRTAFWDLFYLTNEKFIKGYNSDKKNNTYL